MNSLKYIPFDKFVFRAPTFPINVSNDEIFTSNQFLEAIYLATPDLYEELTKLGKVQFAELPEKLKISVLKYIIRNKFRCTPFGLFAGCGIGRFGDRSNIVVDGEEDYKSCTRLDMTYFNDLCIHISQNMDVRDELTFYPNDTLNEIPNFSIRYIEHFTKNGHKKYTLSEIKPDFFTRLILNKCSNGLRRSDLIQELVVEGIEYNEAAEYIDIIILNQLIVPKIAFSGVGSKDVISQLINWLTSFNGLSPLYISQLTKIKQSLGLIDSQLIGERNSFYEDVIRHVEKIGVKFEKKFLFQSDLSVYPKKATLSKDVLDTVESGLRLLNKITSKKQNLVLKKFKSNFFNKYEKEEISLLEALDVDLGVDFSYQSKENSQINPLLDDLWIREASTIEDSSGTDPFAELILKKYNAFLEFGLSQIEITDIDVENFPEEWGDLPDTIYSLVEILDVKGPKVFMKTTGGSSAANLLGRFCHSHDEINELANNIANVEERLIRSDQILAEIVHVPQHRLGNVIYRPNFRNFQIPILSNGPDGRTKDIPLSDLLISMPDSNRIILRSKSLDKEVLPRLTNAHNFSTDSLSIYHFLSLLQYEGKRSYLKFNWGSLYNSHAYLPRVVFKNIILSPAKWRINYESIKKLSTSSNSDYAKTLEAFITAHKLPRKAYLAQGDNRLLIDFHDGLSIQLFISQAKNQINILEEYLFNEVNSLIRNDLNCYTNEVILGFRKPHS